MTQHDPRFDLALGGEWEFAYSATCSPDATPVPPGEFRASMPVPACWDEHLDRLRQSEYWGKARFSPAAPIVFPVQSVPDAALPHLIGVGWYRKTFVLSKHLTRPCASLRVGGVRTEAWVWLNGKYVGYHIGHSTPFEMALDGVRPNGAPNELVVAVANTRTDRGGSALRGWHGGAGGIYRSVHLHAAAQLRIADLYLHPTEDLREIVWRFSAVGDAQGDDYDVSWSIRDPGTERVVADGRLRGRSFQVEWRTDAKDLEPWSDRRPALYDARVFIELAGRTCDVARQSFGLRRLTREGLGLRLNGQPVYLRGACEHHYFPTTCTPPRDIEPYRTRIRALKALGFNWLRCHTWVPPEEYLSAADELGMMIQVEAPVGFGADEWRDILSTCRRHPSVVIYCCGNEELLDDAKIAVLRDRAAMCREFAPDALFSPHEALRGVEYFYTPPELGPDAVDDPYPHNPRRLAALTEFSDVFGSFAWGLLSYESAKGDWRVIDDRLAAYERPCLSHEVCLHGTYLNVDLERRYEGTQIGPALFRAARAHLAAQGLLHRAPIYYRASCLSARSLRKHCLETARLCRHVAGYDLLGAHDHHWHRTGYDCGLMNEFLELKPGETEADVRRYNGESVLLLDHRNQRNHWAGASRDLDLYVSHFGLTALKGADVTWRLADDEGRVHARGRLEAPDVPPGTLTRVGGISLAWPDVRSGRKFTLHARLSSEKFELENGWDFWVFPACSAAVGRPSSARTGARRTHGGTTKGALQTTPDGVTGNEGVRVVAALDAEALAFLESGGRVVLLGTAPFPAARTRFQPQPPGRPLGRITTVIEHHPLLDDFPHDGFCDWQFRALLDAATPVVFDQSDLPFDPIIDVVSSYKNVVKQAVLFEYRAGGGRLLVCSFSLDTTDPATAYLVDRMLTYAASERFQPRTELSMAALRRLLGRPGTVEGDVQTDQAVDPRTLTRRSQA
jgi:beta-galactosidase